MEIFKLFGSIFINTDAAEKSMKSIGKTMEEIGDKVSDFGSKLTKTVTAGITALGTAAVVSASGFEDAMAKVSTIADESEMSMDDMKRAILDLSNQTGVSATAIAEDVYNAISAGQKTADAVNFVSNSTKLARAGFAETGQSLDILTTIMNAYGLEAKDVTRVSDVLIQTQNLGKTTVADLASSMGKIIPTAKAQGVELESLCGAYAVMTANGIATAETTTYLNSMLNELGKQGTSAAKAFADGTGHIKEGGLTMAEAMEQGWDLTDVLSILAEQADISGTSIANMFGSAEAGKAANVLWDNAQKVNSAVEAMGASAGATDTAFGKLETTSFKVQKAINEAKNVLVDLGGTILEMLIPYIEKGAQKVHEFADWFKGLDDNTKETIVKIGLLVAAVGPLLTIFGKGISVVGNVITVGSKLVGGIGSVLKIGGSLASGVTKITGLFSSAASFVGTTLIPAIASIGAPVLIVIGVITALIAIGVALYKNWDEISEWASNTWDKIKNIVGGAVEKIRGFFEDIIDFVKNNWQGLLLFIVNPFAGAFKLLYDNCETFRNFINGFLDKLKAKFSEFVDNIKNFLTGIIDFIKDNWQGILLFLVNPFVGGFKLLYDNCESFRNFIDGFLGNIKEKFGDFVGKIADDAHEMKEKVISRVKEMKEDASRRVSEMKEKITAGFQDMKERAAEKFSDLKEKWSGKFSEARETIISEAEEIRQKVGDELTQLRDRAAEKIADIAVSAINGFGTLREKGAAAVNFLKEDVSTSFQNMATFVFSKFEQFGKDILSVFSGVSDTVRGIVDKVKEFFNFDWKLPDIKLPHFKVDWDKSGALGTLASKIGLPGLPKLDVEWYKDGGIMQEPTLFGVNRASGKLMGGGEAGPEAIAPIDLLKTYIREAIEERDGQLSQKLEAILALLREYLPKFANMQIVLDNGTLVGELAPLLDDALSWIMDMRGRRN